MPKGSARQGKGSGRCEWPMSRTRRSEVRDSASWRAAAAPQPSSGRMVGHGDQGHQHPLRRARRRASRAERGARGRRRGHAVARAGGGRVRRRQVAPGQRADARRARLGRARAERRLRRARRGRAALRPAGRGAAPRSHATATRPSTACPRASCADLATILPVLGGEAARGGRARPSRCGSSRRCWRCSTRCPRSSGLLLVIEDLHWADSSTRGFVRFLARTLCTRADAGRRHLPLRRAAPPPPAAAAAGGAGARPARPPDRARPAHARRDGRAARGHPRQPGRPGPARSGSTRAARATRCSPRSCSRSGSTGAARCRRRCATRSCCAWSGSRTPPRRCCAGSPASRSTTTCSAELTGLDPRELREGLREAVGEPDRGRPPRRQLRLPPRAAARGGLRRPAAGRARRAARRDRAGARAGAWSTRASACT